MFRILLVIVLFTCSACKQETADQGSSINNKYHDKANLFRDQMISDSAFYYYSIAKDEYLSDKNAVKAAQALINMAIIQCDNGDYFGSIETSLEADTLLAKKNDKMAAGFLAANYNNLAIASNKLKNFDQAEHFYQLALKYVTDPENKKVYYNNIGDVLITKGDYKNALRNLEVALRVKDSMSYARALNNWAYAKNSEDRNFNPVPYYIKALKIRLKDGNKYGLNSSYVNLCDYYAVKDPAVSLRFAKQMKQAAQEAGSAPDLMEAIKRIIILDKNNYLKNFQTYNALNTEIQLNSSKAKNQFALIRYGVEKSRAENSMLKVEKLESQKKMIFLAVIAAVLIMIIVAVIIASKKRRKRLQQEKDLEVKNTELKYSKKVHDVVANGLYHIMVEIENNPEVDKKTVLNGIEKLYEESRDIAKDDHDSVSHQEFSQRLYEMLVSYSSDHQRMLVIGNTPQIWERISAENQMEIFYVLRELMVNMRKHSQAKFASLIFEVLEEILHVKYTDNGIGMTSAGTLKKSGLQNMENRIEKLGGTFNFEPNHKGGLMIDILISNN